MYSYSMGIAGQFPQAFILHCHYILCCNHTWLTSVKSCDMYKGPLPLGKGVYSQLGNMYWKVDEHFFRVAVICIPENNTQNVPIFLLFVFFLVHEIYAHVTKHRD